MYGWVTRKCGRKLLSERVGFDGVRVGDRLRVTYVEGGVSGWHSAGVLRSVAGRVAVGALGKVWLSAEGYTIAHVGWPDMKIYRLS